jgi:signal transduction histidine kinase
MSLLLRLGMASRLLLAFAALIVPLAVFSVWSYQRTLDDRRDDALTDQVQLTRTFATMLDAQLRDFDTTMLATSEALGAQQRPLDQESVGPLLATLAAHYPIVRAIFLLDPAGHVAASPSGQTVGMDLSAQPYARALMQGQDFILTGAIPGAETGRRLVVMARAIRDADRRLRGILAFAVYPDRFSELFPGLLLPDSLLNVLDEHGSLLYTSASESLPGEQPDMFRDVPIVQQALAGKVASSERSISPLDGQERLAAAAPLKNYGWVILVSRTTESVQRPLDAGFRRVALALGAATGVALVLAWIVSQALVHPLERLARRAWALGRGEPSQPVPVSGPPEVRALADAFNAMALELQARLDGRQAALDEAKAALSVRDQFLSVAAHELRTPLTALKGQVQIAQRRLAGGTPPAELEPLLRRADTQVDRLSDLISDLLDVTRISSGRLMVEPEPIAPAAMIRRVVELEQAMTPHRRIEFDAPERLPVIEADPMRLEQVLFNLMENALKYSPPSTPVRVHAAVINERLVIDVEDGGAGIAVEDQAFIFERFRRASNVDQNISGLGLGLYISREIVEAHGGRLTVSSRVGAGSTFRISLPAIPIPIDPDLVGVPLRATT